MSPDIQLKHTPSQGASPTALLAFGLLAIAAMALRLGIDNPVGRELWPGPDAVEYAETARRLASFHGPGLDISGVVVPSRYPVLFPLLLVPVEWVVRSAMGLSTAMAALGALSVFLAALLAHRLTSSVVAALLAATLVLASPAHVLASHFVMSDLAGVVIFQAALLLALHHERHPPGKLALALAGLMDGALVALRIAAAPLTAVLALYRVTRLRNNRIQLAIYAAGLAAAPLLEAIHRTAFFGSPFASGYEYYVPSFRPGSGFHSLALQWLFSTDDGSRTPNLVYFGKLIAGLDPSLLPLPVVGILGAMTGAILLSRSRAEVPSRAYVSLLLIQGPNAALALQLLYYWQEPRMVLAWVPILATFLAVAVARVPKPPLRLALAAAILAWPLWNLPAARHFPVKRQGFSGELARSIQATTPDVVVTNLGVPRVRCLLFPGPNAPQILSLTDSIRSDEHVYRNSRQASWPPDRKPFVIPVVATWSSPEHGGSGQLTLQPTTTTLLASHGVILLLQPDKESEAATQLLRQAGWSIQPLGTSGDLTWATLDPPRG